jgi:hypothetical protein
LIVALEEFFGRVQIFGNELTLAKYCQKERPSEGGKQAVDEMVRNRGLRCHARMPLRGLAIWAPNQLGSSPSFPLEARISPISR